MGLCPSKPSRNRLGSESEVESEENGIAEEINWTAQDTASNLKHIERLLKEMQDHNLRRMKDEIETDIHTFILNNLLMCIQFFDNFER
jgi:hypothetical protein